MYPLACPANAEVQWEIVNQGETSDKPIIWEEVPDKKNIPEQPNFSDNIEEEPLDSVISETILSV